MKQLLVLLQILGLSALFTLSFGCASAPKTEEPLISQWTPSDSPIISDTHSWLELNQSSRRNLVVKIANDDHYLYLFLATTDRPLKIQLLGAYHQSFDILFETGTGAISKTRGVRIAFHHLPGVGFPKSKAEEPEYWKATTHEITELASDLKDYPRVLIPKSTDLSLDTVMDHGQLSYVLKLPLQGDAKQPWSLDIKPGERVKLRMETSPIEVEAAFIELAREYQEDLYGWGWEQKGYGPKKDLNQSQAFGLGNYDKWGLDQSIYATHGLYGRLSWDSVPPRISLQATLQLAQDEAR